jgi:hypothetical protein
MYIYDETTGKKGSNESVSLLEHYIDKYIWRTEDCAYFQWQLCRKNKNILMAQLLN